MMEAVRTSETLVNLHQSTWHYNPEDSHLHTHRNENFKSYKLEVLTASIMLMMEAVWTCDTLVNLYQPSWHYNPDDCHVNIYSLFSRSEFWLCLVFLVLLKFIFVLIIIDVDSVHRHTKHLQTYRRNITYLVNTNGCNTCAVIINLGFIDWLYTAS
jgi:hypothetical protein